MCNGQIYEVGTAVAFKDSLICMSLTTVRLMKLYESNHPVLLYATAVPEVTNSTTSYVTTTQ